jgi:hypothetical protein
MAIIEETPEVMYSSVTRWASRWSGCPEVAFGRGGLDTLQREDRT